jgi:hypothetical protein
MSIDKAVDKFDKILSGVRDSMPIVELKDGSVCFENYIIKRNNKGMYDLIQIGKRQRRNIESFYQKTSALISAKNHRKNDIMGIARIKDIDQRYWSNHSDSLLYGTLYKRTDDLVKRDIFLWRHELCRERAIQYRDQISNTFIQSFN